jgi:hypothetical protein
MLIVGARVVWSMDKLMMQQSKKSSISLMANASIVLKLGKDSSTIENQRMDASVAFWRRRTWTDTRERGSTRRECKM